MTTDRKPLDGSCCPIFHPEKWDRQDLRWTHKHFIKASVPAFMHIPFVPILQKKILKLVKQAETAKKLDENVEDTLMLFNDPHPFRSDVYLSVTEEVPGARNTELSGNFLTKVYAGDYNEIPKFFKQMNQWLRDKGKRAKNYFVHYAYCPKCSKKAGINYTILFAEV